MNKLIINPDLILAVEDLNLVSGETREEAARSGHDIAEISARFLTASAQIPASENGALPPQNPFAEITILLRLLYAHRNTPLNYSPSIIEKVQALRESLLSVMPGLASVVESREIAAGL